MVFAAEARTPSGDSCVSFFFAILTVKDITEVCVKTGTHARSYNRALKRLSETPSLRESSGHKVTPTQLF